MNYYHATVADSYHKILNSGEIHTGYDGIVYLADSVQNAIKFIALRHFNEKLFIFEIEDLDDSKIEETFDHSESFFQCKAYGYPENISLTHVKNVYVSEPNIQETSDEESK